MAPAPVVKDADGHILGISGGADPAFSGGYIALRKNGNDTVAIEYAPLFLYSSSIVYFPSYDCVGQPFMTPVYGPGVAPYPLGVVVAGMLCYIPFNDFGGATETTITSDFSNSGCVNYDSPLTLNAVPAVTATGLPSYGPFHIEIP
jgi:hypothetical protein